MRRHGWAAIPAWLGHVKGCSCLSVRDPGPLLTAGAWAVVSHSAGAALLSGQGTWQSVCLSIYPSGHATWRGGGTEVLPCWLLLQGGSGICHCPRELCLVLGAESSTPRQVCRQQAMDQGHVSRTTEVSGLALWHPFPKALVVLLSVCGSASVLDCSKK